MARSRLPVPRKILGKEGEYMDWTAGWLEQLDMNNVGTHERESDETAEEQKEKPEPITPPRRSTTPPAARDEISPTDTSFRATASSTRRCASKCGSGVRLQEARSRTTGPMLLVLAMMPSGNSP
jgi:hypothetical protein